MALDRAVLDVFLREGEPQLLPQIHTRFTVLSSIQQQQLLVSLQSEFDYELEDCHYGKGGSFATALNYAQLLMYLSPDDDGMLCNRVLAYYHLAVEAEDDAQQACPYLQLAMDDLQVLLSKDADDLWSLSLYADCLLAESAYQTVANMPDSLDQVIAIWDRLSEHRTHYYMSDVSSWWPLLQRLKSLDMALYDRYYLVFCQRRDTVSAVSLVGWIYGLTHLYRHQVDDALLSALAVELRVLLQRSLSLIDVVDADALSVVGNALQYFADMDGFPIAPQQCVTEAIQLHQAACEKAPQDAFNWLYLSNAYQTQAVIEQMPLALHHALQACVDCAHLGAASIEIAYQGAELAKKVLLPELAIPTATAFHLAETINWLGYRSDSYIALVDLYLQQGQPLRAQYALQAALEHFQLRDEATRFLTSEQYQTLLTPALITMLEQDMQGDMAYYRESVSVQYFEVLHPLSQAVPRFKEDFDAAVFWQAFQQAQDVPSTYWLRLIQGRYALNAFKFLDASQQFDCLNLAYQACAEAESIRPGFHIAPLAACIRAKTWLRSHFGDIVDNLIVSQMIVKGIHYQ